MVHRFLLCLLCMPMFSLGQPIPSTRQYIAELYRTDSLPIRFNLDVMLEVGAESWIIRNASEKIPVVALNRSRDSVQFSLPVFESTFRLRQSSNGYEGSWIKGTPSKDALMPVGIWPGELRFPASRGKALGNLSGRWRVTFIRPNGTPRLSVAEFVQKGEKLTGTFLNPSGDYRYLEGVMSGDSMQLSCFDGSHAYYFGARLAKDGSLVNGVYASGASYLEKWTAVKDPSAKIDPSIAAMELKPGEESVGFQFPDLDSQLVSLHDMRFRDKAVVIQIMGSWCPNCMDETAFLSEYYRNNRQRGIEMIALAYEYSTDFQRARKSLMKFRNKFDVQYPMLITGITSGDSLKTEKTLPQLTPIKAFPTTIFIGRDGKVKKIHAGFYGPGTGSYYDAFKKEFEETIETLLK